MFRYFVKNKHGYVTVMLLCMLIAVLFFNTTFLEIGRYKTISKLYGEIQENAAFSVLANYDRDLHENYGLLAVGNDVDSSTLTNYINANINLGGSGASSINTPFDSVEADLQKLYFLSEKDVFKNQINEFSAYRAPIALVNNTLNLEDTLGQLINDLESSSAALESLQSFAEAGSSMLDAYQGMIDFYNEVIDSYIPAVESLKDSVSTLKELVDKCKELKDQIAAINAANAAAEENEDFESIQDVEPYVQALEATYQQVTQAVHTMSDCMDTMKEAIEGFKETNKKFGEAFKAMKEAEANWSLDAAKSDDTEEMASQMDETYTDSKEKTEKTAEKIEPFDDAFFEAVKNDIDAKQQEYLAVANDPETVCGLQLPDEEDPFKVALKYNGSDIFSVSTELGKNIDDAEKELKEKDSKEGGAGEITLSDIEDITKILVKIVRGGGMYNRDYQEQITGISLVEFSETVNAFEAADTAYVNSMLADVEGLLNIDVTSGSLTAGDGGYSSLEQALKNLTYRSQNLQNAIQKFSFKNAGLMQMISCLKDIISAVVEFFKAAVLAIAELVSQGLQALMHIVYEKLIAAVYATEMFTNRSTNLDKDTRMNGSSFDDCTQDADGKVFAMADAEYVYWGSRYERSNQRMAYLSIYGLRIFANIPAILRDNVLREVATAIAEIPYVGPVLAVVLYVLIIAAEAYLDMVFMIFGEVGVKIIKMEGYLNFSGKGIDELKNQLEEIFNILGADEDDAEEGGSSVSKGGTKSLKSKFSSTLGDAKDGITRWDYKDHLFVCLCFFVGADKMYEREADLIQMHMAKQKGEDFKLSEMATLVRTDTKVSYKPLLPVPYYGGGIPIRKLYYTGY